MQGKSMQRYYIYIIRCENGELYTGITNDVQKRFESHKSGKGAKYTKSHIPKSIEAIWQTGNKSNALKLEFRIKKLKKQEKELLLLDNNNLKNYFSGILDLRSYRRKK